MDNMIDQSKPIEYLEKHKNNIGLIYKTILTEGRELYAA